MRLALVTETFLPSTDGVVVRLSKAMDYMIARGHEVLIIAPDIPGLKTSYKGAQVLGAPALVFPFYKERAWSLPSKEVKTWLRDFKPDLVHAANPISLAASGAHYAYQLDIPLICSFHTNIPKYLAHYKLDILEPAIWSYIRHWHNKAPINLVTSQAMHEELRKNGIGGLRVLPKGVDLDMRDPSFYSKKTRDMMTQGQVDRTALVFVGRLAPEKEVIRLLPLMEKRDDISLTIVGDGPDRQELEEAFKGTSTNFTGFVHGRRLAELYASADAFVFPSVSETLGLVITESMASGTPVLAADSAPTRDQVRHGENGLIFDKDDLASLEACLDLLKDPDISCKIRQEGLAYARSFSWEAASSAMEEAYLDSLAIYQDLGLAEGA